MERRLTTILAADVVGYSRLMGADEAGTLAALKGLPMNPKPETARPSARALDAPGPSVPRLAIQEPAFC